MKNLLIFCFLSLVIDHASAQLIYSDNGRNISLGKIETLKLQNFASDTTFKGNPKEAHLSKNIMYIEMIGATGFGFSINYRRTIPLSDKVSLNPNGGAGIIFYSFSESPDFVIPVSLTISIGKKSAFEAGIGFSYLVLENIMAPNILLGYTRKKGNNFLWLGVVNLVFIETENNDVWFIPAPGFRIGWVL